MLAVVAFVLIHELGHVLAAAAYGYPVRQVRLGCGPVLWHPTVHGVRLLVCLIPLCVRVGILQPDTATLAQQRLIAAGGVGLGIAFMLSLALTPGLLSPIDRIGFVAMALLDLMPLRGSDGWRILHR